METNIKKQIVPLNIVMTYPVHWNKYEIMRDFLQNFYDSLGYQRWNEHFHSRLACESWRGIRVSFS